ncbi:MAG: hypothetical protein WCJ63_01125 [Actinomycetes bacterium]
MSNLLITQIVVALAIVGSIALFLRFVALPGVAAREGTWPRVAAVFLSVYAFAVFAALGVGIGIAIIWLWPQIT